MSSSTLVVHTKRKPRCRSCRGRGVNFASPIFGVGAFADIVVDYRPCHCTRRVAR